MTCSKINPCYKCGCEPTVVNIYDLWYIKCIPCDIIEVNPNKETVIENWNEVNPLTQKLSTQTKRKNVVRRSGKNRGRNIPVYRLSTSHERLERYESITELADKLHINRMTLAHMFQVSKTGRITIKGTIYGRDTVKTAPKTTRRGGTKQTK